MLSLNMDIAGKHILARRGKMLPWVVHVQTTILVFWVISRVVYSKGALNVYCVLACKDLYNIQLDKIYRCTVLKFKSGTPGFGIKTGKF